MRRGIGRISADRVMSALLECADAVASRNARPLMKMADITIPAR
jgi:hypothetical protein